MGIVGSAIDLFFPARVVGVDLVVVLLSQCLCGLSCTADLSDERQHCEIVMEKTT